LTHSKYIYPMFIVTNFFTSYCY